MVGGTRQKSKVIHPYQFLITSTARTPRIPTKWELPSMHCRYQITPAPGFLHQGPARGGVALCLETRGATISRHSARHAPRITVYESTAPVIGSRIQSKYKHCTIYKLDLPIKLIYLRCEDLHFYWTLGFIQCSKL